MAAPSRMLAPAIRRGAKRAAPSASASDHSPGLAPPGTPPLPPSSSAWAWWEAASYPPPSSDGPPWSSTDLLQYRLGLAGIGALRAERRFPSSRAEVPEEEVPCHPDDDKVKLGPPPPPGRDLLDGHIPGDQQAQIWNHFLVFSCKKARRLEVRKATLE